MSAFSTAFAKSALFLAFVFIGVICPTWPSVALSSASYIRTNIFLSTIISF
jgi:hypothetical protein